jgi:enterochelin esterase-like enzyme
MRRRAWLLAVVLPGLLVVAGAWLVRHHRARDRSGPGAGLAAAIAEVEARRATTPLVGEPNDDGSVPVTFLARSAGAEVPRIVSDVTGWGENVADGTFDLGVGTMTRVGRTEWYSLRADVAPRARVEYLVAYGPADYRLDPCNPRRSGGPRFGGAPASEFVTPGYRPPPEFAEPPPSPAGLLTEAVVESRALAGSHRLTVYTPAGYRGDGDYPLAVILDMRSPQVSRVLDWLIAHRAIEPLVAAFVRPTPAANQDAAGAHLRRFLNAELPRWMESHYAVTGTADRRAVIGISFGARDALDAALPSSRAADAFGRLGLVIPGRRINVADIDAIAERRGHALRVAILAGAYDRANLATARSLRRALADAGHSVEYTEVPEGHSAVTWATNLRVVLVGLFGTPAAARPVEYRRPR